jgi:hypothetical protein
MASRILAVMKSSKHYLNNFFLKLLNKKNKHDKDVNNYSRNDFMCSWNKQRSY